MPPWNGTRPVAVVSACMNANGSPDFALNEVEVTHEEYEEGVHYLLVEDRLADAGYDEPYVHFDQFESPRFLHAAVRAYLGAPRLARQPTPATRPEEPRCPASSK